MGPPENDIQESGTDSKDTAIENTELESGAYEVLQARLRAHGTDLRERLDRLHAKRREVFGSVEMALTGTERLTTEHKCVPRDLVALGNVFLLGYNVQLGLKNETVPGDVLAVGRFESDGFKPEDLSLIRSPQFESDFADLYRYYKKTQFAKFAVKGPFLYMVFRIGKSPTDVKTFKWRIQGDKLEYLDNRSDHEFRFPSQHEFDWQRTHRDLHRYGAHPHVSIEDRIFVETVGGDLTIKIENNTESGQGIYAEPVENVDQTLDDAEIWYAVVGSLILLRIRPYQEKAYRYIVYNEKLKAAHRIDRIEDSCVLLPEDQGIVFSNGIYLETGERKVFDSDLTEMLFERRLTSPNGEDYLYVFYNRASGTYVLLPYNIIDQAAETPTVCHGYALFPDGRLVLFRTENEPQRHHALQIWATPYYNEEHAPAGQGESYLTKIGNRDLVRGMAECHALMHMTLREDAYATLYIDLLKEAGDVLDAYFWLGNSEVENLREVLVGVRDTASAAIGEFDKVAQLKRSTRAQIEEVASASEKALKDVAHARFERIDEFVASLAALRAVRGRIISLKDLRYTDLDRIEILEEQVRETGTQLAGRCVEFLLSPLALTPYVEAVEEKRSRIDGLTKVSDARELENEVEEISSGLELLIETVSNLEIDDSTQRTAVIDSISEIFTTLNQVRATLRQKAHRDRIGRRSRRVQRSAQAARSGCRQLPRRVGHAREV